MTFIYARMSDSGFLSKSACIQWPPDLHKCEAVPRCRVFAFHARAATLEKLRGILHKDVVCVAYVLLQRLDVLCAATLLDTCGRTEGKRGSNLKGIPGVVGRCGSGGICGSGIPSNGSLSIGCQVGLIDGQNNVSLSFCCKIFAATPRPNHLSR